MRMRIMVAEYAYAVGEKGEKGSLFAEGKAMLETLRGSFKRIGNEVVCPSSQGEINFEAEVEKLSRECDAGIVIAPDEMLCDLTKIVESNTVNLGSPAYAVETCVDKLCTTKVLHHRGIPVPRIVTEGIKQKEGKYVVKKPRYGCGSENVFIQTLGKFDAETFKKGLITEYIQGEDISSSIVVNSSYMLPLTINKQFVREEGGRLKYEGGLVPYSMKPEIEDEIMRISGKVASVLRCEGYVGIDFVVGEVKEGNGIPYVIDVNPRPTTSIVGIAKVLNYEIADLILRANFGDLPSKEEVKTEGCFMFCI
jgi:hypothetical protein